MKILFVASECAPIAKVGGLADVIGALPKALKKLGTDVSVLIPFYECLTLKKEGLKLTLEGEKIQFNGGLEIFNLWQTFIPKSKVPLFLVENKKYFQGNIYLETDASAGGSEEEAKRFLFLSAAAAIKIAEILKFNILHCQDWHTAIVASLLKNKNIKNLLTIHNLQYQGIYSCQIVNRLLNTDFKENVNCLKEGISNADFINTVSPNYAKEILTSEYGYGLENFLKQRKNNLIGILNGIDIEEFNPKTDKNLKTNYSLQDIEKKEENKIYLQKKYFKKAEPNIPILGMVSRLANQKGIDLIKEIFPVLMKENLQFILLGTCTKEYEVFFEENKKEFPQKFWVKIGFDDNLARQIYAGADIFLMPSLFEPCGLGQLIAMRYGTLPIVRAVGGLKDTVTEETGFLFKNYNAQALLQVIKKALGVYENKKIWKKMQKKGMKQDFSWEKSAKKYLKIYKKLFK